MVSKGRLGLGVLEFHLTLLVWQFGLPAAIKLGNFAGYEREFQGALADSNLLWLTSMGNNSSNTCCGCRACEQYKFRRVDSDWLCSSYVPYFVNRIHPQGISNS